LHRAIDGGDTGYPVGTALAGALSDFAGRRWGWNTIDVVRTAVVPDVMTGMFGLICSLTVPGDVVIVNRPVETPFYGYNGACFTRDPRTSASISALSRMRSVM
jgi:cystathionine beta-lyase